MRRYNSVWNLPASTSLFTLAIAAFATPALAQPAADSTNAAQPTADASAQPADAAAPDEGEAIVVTGSRIARPEFTTLQPTQVIGNQQIQDRGYSNIGQALQELPAFGPPGNSGVGAQSSFGPAQTFVDFFSLGTQRTLTLVNGRRFVSSNTASIFGPVASGTQVDLNNIPTTLIDRVEVVAVGGAPIYGSDAIAGTINIILRRNFQGLQLEGQYGISERGDAADRRISALVGHNFADGRGNITLSGEWNKVDGLTASSRAITRQGLFFGTPPSSAGSSFSRLLYPDQRYSAFTIGGVPFSDDDYLARRSGIRDANGNLLQFGANGTLVPLDLGTVLRQGYISSGGNGFALPLQSNLLTSSERYLGTALASFEFSPHFAAFAEGWYVHSTGRNLIDQPNYNTALFDAAGTADGNLILSLDNPFLSAADRATIAANLPAGQNQFYVGRALADLTTGSSEATVETYRLVGGFRGDFSLGGHAFDWEVSANYGHSQTRGHVRELVQQNFANALDAVRDANGNIVCRPGYTNANIATGSSTCAPLNIFGRAQASQAAIDYIFTTAKPISNNSQLVFNANVQGSLFRLPGGDVQVSLGVEHRRESTDFEPGAYYFGEPLADGTRQQFGRTIPIDPVSGSYHTNEVFGELTIPIVSAETGLSWLRTLELDGAARYVDNSLVGGDLTWTAGGRLAFFRDLTFRGNFTRSIRNPAITEVFNPTSRAFDVGQDPCDTRYVGNGPNPDVRRANCTAAGINVANFTSNYSDFTVPVTVSGNPNLSSEKADSWTVGAVLQPRFLPGFSAAVDWVSIRLRGAIESLGGDDILNACYDSPSYPNSFCGAVDRDPTGQITMIREGYFNAASRRFDGLTATVAYRRDLRDFGLGGTPGTVGLNVNYLYTSRLDTRVGTGDINHLVGEIGNPRHQGTANLTYQNGGFTSLLQLQYFGRARFEIDEPENARDVRGVGDWWLWNATIGYDVNRQFGLRLIVDNIFDKDPPYPFTRSYNAMQTYSSGVFGRSYRVSATVRF